MGISESKEYAEICAYNEGIRDVIDTLESFVQKEETHQEIKKKVYYASGSSLIEGKWQSCGWSIEAESFTEAAKIAEADETFRLSSLSNNVV